MPETKDPKNERPDDASDDDYRDDPSTMGQSSEYAQRGTTGRYSGEGPGDRASNDDGVQPGAGNNAGSQEDWRGRPDAADDANKTDDGKEIRSRSADPGQSSYGGFKDKGPGPGGDHEAAKPDAKP